MMKIGGYIQHWRKAATLTLRCEKRKNAAAEPQVTVTSDKPVTVRVFWDGGRQSKTVKVK